jgi:hypothetical protein
MSHKVVGGEATKLRTLRSFRWKALLARSSSNTSVRSLIRHLTCANPVQCQATSQGPRNVALEGAPKSQKTTEVKVQADDADTDTDTDANDADTDTDAMLMMTPTPPPAPRG